ncbi:MAG: YggS family pyridoxal phosphate-dependent enzyme [Candidatus Kapabacteria bacterium]|nr:YggS family pyridoxal phosphate-dependent enzyme [Candidatus Kapabacteria bacterium]
MTLADAYRRTLDSIAAAAESAGRQQSDVRLLLATKTVQPDRLREAALAGARLFGENRVQEALPKIEPLLDCDIEWHMIGHLQTNKVRDALRFASCIHSVDRESLVLALQKECLRLGRTCDVLVEVNTSGEANKHGIAPDDVGRLLDAIAATPELRLRGFMTIGAHSDDEGTVRACFASLRRISERATAEGRVTGGPPVLSMGMSGDLAWAIAEGSTLVRVGSAIFGQRE